MPKPGHQAATSESARTLGVGKKYGSLERDKVADFVVLNGDLLADVRNTRQIDSTWMESRLFDRTGLGRWTTGRAA